MISKNQISFLWDKMKNECSTYWKDEQIEQRAFLAFCGHFERNEYEDLLRGVDYVIRYLIRNSYDWPTTTRIRNAISTSAQPKPYEPDNSEDTRGDAGFSGFVKKLSEVKVTKAYERKAETDTKNVITMSGVLNKMFRETYLKPALADERKKRLAMTRVDMELDSLEDGKCWYCGIRCYRPNIGQATGKVQIAEYHVCPRCKTQDGENIRYGYSGDDNQAEFQPDDNGELDDFEKFEKKHKEPSASA